MPFSDLQTRMICIVVAALTTLAVTLSMGLAGYFWTMGSASALMDKVAQEWEHSLRGQGGGIRSGGNIAALEAYHEELLGKAALPGEGARHTDSLNVGLVTFDKKPESRTETDKARKAVFPSIVLDVEGLKRTSVLFIGDGPIQWNPTKSRPDQRAKLAFEGRAPVAIEGLRHGLLAGLKIKGIDTTRASGVDTVDDDRRRFCRSLRSWTDFYEVSPRHVYVWRITLPFRDATLIAHEDGFDAGTGRVWSVGTMIYLCDI